MTVDEEPIVIKDRERFLEVRQAILCGQCPPSTGQLKKRYHMDYYTARDYLRKLFQDGHLNRNEKNSHYSLKPLDQRLTDEQNDQDESYLSRSTTSHRHVPSSHHDSRIAISASSADS